MLTTSNLLLFKPHFEVISYHFYNECLTSKNHDIVNLLHSRVRYIFTKLKEITESSVIDFNYINAYDNDNNVGFFEINKSNNHIEFSGNFSDKYSKPFGFSFPQKFLFINFENAAKDVYKQFLLEKDLFQTINHYPEFPLNTDFQDYSFEENISKI